MSGPVRVAMVMGKMLGGGVEAVVMNYYRHIDRSRVQFDFLVDADSTLVPRGEIEALGGRVLEVPPYQRVAEYQRELQRLFRQERWPIVHSHVNALSVFPLRAAAVEGVPVRIAHSHSTSGRGEPAKNAAKALLRTQANRYPTHRLACGRYAGEWLFGEGAEFEVVYNAIDLSRFAFDAAARRDAREELGIAEGQLVVGHAGRFTAQKNHLFLLEAFEEVARRRGEAVLLLAGEGGGRAQAEEWVEAHGLSSRVRFLGQRGDVERLYSAFDVFALPSLYEGLCVVGVEAQAAGLPCFFSDRITREVELTGGARFLPIDDPSIWADAVCAVEPNPSVRAGAGVPRGLEPYDITRAAPRLASMYERMLREVGADVR